MRLMDFFVSYPDRLWIAIGDPPTWRPVPDVLTYIPPAHLQYDVLITRRPGVPEGHIWIEELAVGYAWRATKPEGGPPESPSMAVRWRAWRRGNRR